MANVSNVKLTTIIVDPALQPRIGGIDPDHVHILEAVAESWAPLVAVVVDGRHALIDGFHRYAAAQNLGLETITVEVVDMPADGDLKALAFALNAKHGRPLSLSDRRAEAERLLRARPDWADREIGRRCGLAQPTVAKLRTDLETSAQIEQTDVRVGRGGYTYAVGTNSKQRPAGEFPEEGVGERVGSAVGRLFTSEERRQQRLLTSYFRRLAVALEDGDDVDGWVTDAEAADACRRVLGDEHAAELRDRLGRTSRNVLNVAIALGYADEDAA